MLHGLYSSAQGAHVQQERLAVIANNLANAGTTAFKRDVPVVGTVPQFDHLLGRFGKPNGLDEHLGATVVGDVVTDHSDGPLEPTGRPLDVALRGPGFFRVTDGEREFFTRDGALTVDSNGVLVTVDQGLPVLDVQGLPIDVPAGASQLGVGSDGVITDLRFGTIGQLHVVDSPEPPTKVGRSLYAATEDFTEVDPSVTRIVSGHLESSGVEPTTEMLSLIQTTRSFEMNLNVLQTQDNSLSQLLAMASR